MTTATTKTRQRRARATAQALIPRGQHLLDVGDDFLRLSARMAETPQPVFWAPGELDARTTLAVPVEADYGDNYRAVFGDDPWWDWNWYRDALLRDELERIPVFTVTPDALPVLMPGTRNGELPGDAKIGEAVARIMAEAAKRGLVDVPGPEGGAYPPGAAGGFAPGPGTRDEDAGDG